jgi:ATP-dependent RNA helicase RhlE
MQYQVPVVTIPSDVEISSVLTEDEIPKVIMKEISQKVKKVVSTAGPAFHEKSAKNSKSNVKTSRKDVMQKKYKKPIKRGAKKK